MVQLKGKSILVTGGAGFIGSNLVDRLIREEPSNLVVVDNYYLGSENNLREARRTFPALRVFRIDASNMAAMLHLVQSEKIEVVFNLAVIPLPTSFDFPAWTVSINMEIVITFCELARLGYIKTLVHCSSSEVYGSALYTPMPEEHLMLAMTPYAASKAAGDQIIMSYWKTFGIDTVIVRPFNNFGPRQNRGSYAGIIPIVINRVKSGQPMEIDGDGLQTRDYIFVQYTTEAIIRVYETEETRGRSINIATGHEITINDLVVRLFKTLGVPNYPVVHRDPRPGDVRRHCGDVRLLRELTGLKPQPISDQDLAKTVEWFERVEQ
jgi:UDP-glucose 4-epimerase